MAGARTEDGKVLIVGPDGMAVEGPPRSDDEQDDEPRSVTELVEQPAKVMRVANMIRQLLEEVKSAPLDEASRARLRAIHEASIKELESGLAPELVEELERLSLDFTDDSTPTDAELRIAQAQLVGWLEGLFHGIQTALFAQQMAARQQLEQMRRALPGGQQLPPDGQFPDAPQAGNTDGPGSGGMYL
ncbi:bacterial proteasome activator family protein [Kribbella speibonae]|uniref:Bacterial proteasome activator n=2 Tax=Kribbella speibonae TaxID=1572660 RepID=A0A4R0J7P8_9ACTN|nr:bacterial proteasome activator family protein [Kribbella speibonae]TCC19008.1 bacterial proteasome activator family protein [Kribbella speibonae]TCC42571.1 bacterial proteasome activator family protein [Kribbella speibonae]